MVGFLGGIVGVKYYPQVATILDKDSTIISDGLNQSAPTIIEKEITSSQEEQVIKVVNESLPSVVSILAEGEVAIPGLPFFYQQIETGGTGFIISSDGMILTNRHVVQYENINYTVILTNGEKYEAKVLAKDNVQI